MLKIAIQSFAKFGSPSYDFTRSETLRLREFARSDRFGMHLLVDHVDDADIVLIVCMEPASFFAALGSRLWQQRPSDCFVVSCSDRALPLVPGIYTSLEQRFSRESWNRSGSYLRVTGNSNMDQVAAFGGCDLLFSFSGAAENNPVRTRMLELRSGNSLIIDTSAMSIKDRQRDGHVKKEDDYISGYVEMFSRSKFILCPRGIGTSSWRLFETIRAGRVPVIISDDWVAPEGPDWDSFSIRVAEKDVGCIPELLAERERDAEAMACAAREAWEEWFAEDVIFHRLVEWCVSIAKDRKLPVRLEATRYWVDLLRPYYFRYWLVPYVKHMICSRLG